MSRHISLVMDSFPAVPGLDTTLARALLRAVSAERLGETFRIYSPGRVLAFGKRDAISPGFAIAAAAARDMGYTPLLRLVGGRAAVFHEETLAFSWTRAIDDPRARIQEGFVGLSELLVRAFGRVGVAAAIGEIPGEYCPGRFSVHHSGGRKVMGVGQRLARRAAHVGGVIVVNGAAEVNRALHPVYRALGLEFDPSATGALTDQQPQLTVAAVVSAIVAELEALAPVTPATLSTAVVNEAKALLPEHLVPVPDSIPTAG